MKHLGKNSILGEISLNKNITQLVDCILLEQSYEVAIPNPTEPLTVLLRRTDMYIKVQFTIIIFLSQYGHSVELREECCIELLSLTSFSN